MLLYYYIIILIWNVAIEKVHNIQIKYKNYIDRPVAKVIYVSISECFECYFCRHSRKIQDVGKEHRRQSEKCKGNVHYKFEDVV